MVATIESAIASLSASLPDASMLMRHGEAEGTVLSSSSRDLSGDTVSTDAPEEWRRVIGRRRDFPELCKGCAVVLGGKWHLVTSCRTDPVGASLSVGLSAELDEIVAAYRRPGTGIRQPLKVLAVQNAALPPEFTEAAAPIVAQSWSVCVPEVHWLENTPPQTGDEITLPVEVGGAVLRVASATHHDGFWMLVARPRGGAAW